MHQLQKIGLFGITVLLLFGFWAGLWYQAERSGELVLVAEAGSENPASVDGARDGRDTDQDAGIGTGGSGGIGGSILSDGGVADGAMGDGNAVSGGHVIPWGDGAGVGQQLLAVHVVGEVASPGLYYMPYSSRIYDAVMAAEPEEDADLAKLNMAIRVEDGMQIRIPAIGKPSPWGGDGLILRAGDNQEHVSVSGAGTIVSSSSESEIIGKVNINTASAKELETLPGIGPAFSQRIIQYREKHGGFANVDDLMKVSGIGPAKMSNLRELVTCS